MSRRVASAVLGSLVLVSGAWSEPIGASGPVDFQDVPRQHWAYDAVQLCARLGIFEGFEGYQVRPAPDRGASSGGRVLQGSVEAAVPGPSFAPQGLRPRLLDPLAESFAQEMERLQAYRQEAARLKLPPRPEPPRTAPGR